MAFFSLLVYIFCIYIRPQEWVASLAGFPLMSAALILALVFYFAGKRGRGVSAPQNIFMIGLLAALVASHLWHTYFGGAYQAFVDFVKIVILYFLIANIVNTPARLRVTVYALIAFTLTLALQGIAQFNTGYGLAGQPPFIQGTLTRITWIGIFNDPNDLALALVIMVPFLLSYLTGGNFLERIVSIPSLGILIYAMYLTNSRGGMLALLAVFAVFTVVHFKGKKAVAAGVVISLLLGVVLLKYGPSRMAIISAGEDSAYGRIEAWYEGIQMLKSSPIVGVGYNLFTDHAPRTAHNSLVLCFAEIGLLGYFLWIGLFYFSIRNMRMIQNVKSPGEDLRAMRSLAIALETGIVGFLAGAFFLSRTYILLPYLLVGLTVALFNICERTGLVAGNKVTYQDIKNVGLLSLLSLLVTYGVMKVSI